MEKKVSVIIPMYNSSNTIIDSINSILNQSYKNYEIIIIDDGSKDDSYEIVKEFINKNNLMNIIKLLKQENKGPSEARNNGIKNSNGEYIAFLDSDDVWKKDKLKKQVKLMNEYHEVALVGCNINNELNNKNRYILDISYKMLLFKNYFFTPTVMIRKKILDDVGLFDLKQSYSEDYNLWLRICKKYKCVLINESLVVCGDGKPTFGFSGLSSNLWKMEKGELNNYYQLMKNRSINILTFYLVSTFSILKYIRRVALTNLRKVSIRNK